MSVDICEKIERNKISNKESNKQSRAGWGGKRAGAPFGNLKTRFTTIDALVNSFFDDVGTYRR